MLEQIDYQFLDAEDLQNTSLSTAASSSRFLKSLPLDVPEVPLRPLFAELHDVRWLMAEVEAESVLVTISLDLPEIGVRGEAVVTGLEPCPAILPGPGKVVLTTFHHASSDLIDLYLSPQPPTGVNSPSSTHLTSTSSSPTDPLTTLQTSEEALLYPRASRATSIDPSWERIGVTGNHPIWSQDRHDYVAAMDLRIGERLKNLSGDIHWVQQKLPRPGPTPVYNLEVQDEHVYYVGASGVLAHNSTSCDAPNSVLKSAGEQFEESVQNTFRNKIIRQNEVLRNSAGRVLGEIDFETTEAIVEVGTSLRGKVGQLHKRAQVAKDRAKRLDVIYGPDTSEGTLKFLQESLRTKWGNRVRFIPHK